MNIVIKSSSPEEEVEAGARLLLETGIDTGNDEFLERAVYIAVSKKLDVTFISPNGNRIDPDLAYRIVFIRGISLRNPAATSK